MHFNCIEGYVVQGSNGEYAYMRPEEKIDLVRKVRELAPKDKLILAGSGCEGKKIAKDSFNVCSYSREKFWLEVLASKEPLILQICLSLSSLSIFFYALYFISDSVKIILCSTETNLINASHDTRPHLISIS